MDNEDLFPLGCGPRGSHLELTSGSSYLRAGRLGHIPVFSYIPLAKYSSWILTLLYFYVVPVEVKEELKQVLRQKKKRRKT